MPKTLEQIEAEEAQLLAQLARMENTNATRHPSDGNFSEEQFQSVHMRLSALKGARADLLPEVVAADAAFREKRAAIDSNNVTKAQILEAAQAQAMELDRANEALTREIEQLRKKREKTVYQFITRKV